MKVLELQWPAVLCFRCRHSLAYLVASVSQAAQRRVTTWPSRDRQGRTRQHAHSRL